MSQTTGIATRNELLSFMNTGTSDAPKWCLIGEGFSELTENLNAKTKDSHYIHQVSGTSSVMRRHSILLQSWIRLMTLLRISQRSDVTERSEQIVKQISSMSITGSQERHPERR